jgi:hypothetical protein
MARGRHPLFVGDAGHAPKREAHGDGGFVTIVTQYAPRLQGTVIYITREDHVCVT